MGKKSGILSASAESSVRSSISSFASMICVSAVDASVGTLLVVTVEVVAVVVVVVCDFFVGDLYEAVDTFSTNRGSCDVSLSSSHPPNTQYSAAHSSFHPSTSPDWSLPSSDSSQAQLSSRVDHPQPCPPIASFSWTPNAVYTQQPDTDQEIHF